MIIPNHSVRTDIVYLTIVAGNTNCISCIISMGYSQSDFFRYCCGSLLVNFVNQLVNFSWVVAGCLQHNKTQCKNGIG